MVNAMFIFDIHSNSQNPVLNRLNFSREIIAMGISKSLGGSTGLVVMGERVVGSNPGY